MHEEHRKRVRERFFKDGIENMPDHEILELLLFFSIPRKDTNVLAHKLTDHFGSLNGVLEATKDELMRVDGIGESSAALITLVFQMAKRYIKNSSDATLKYYNGPDSVKELLQSKYLGSKEEIAYMLSLDSSGRILNCNKIAQGGLTSALIDKRLILETIFRNKATAVVLVHNHLNGVCSPSHDDVAATKTITASFYGLGVRLIDHLIYTDAEIFSMSKTERFAPLFI
ncbi:MAG: DNA repair protein RadC [Oscillospiraceae bacterium]|nr:DNA repair protein RadC [Oscillospiraceae bacterium]